ncbi:MAG: hypothetical protein AAGB34_09940, partial [Planctomycetota bacterium]
MANNEGELGKGLRIAARVDESGRVVEMLLPSKRWQTFVLLVAVLGFVVTLVIFDLLQGQTNFCAAMILTGFVVLGVFALARPLYPRLSRMNLLAKSVLFGPDKDCTAEDLCIAMAVADGALRGL